MDEIIDLLDSAAKSYPIKALSNELCKAESTLRNELTEQPGYKVGLRTAIQVTDKTMDFRWIDRLEQRYGRVACVIPTARNGKMNEEEMRKCLDQLTATMKALAKIRAYLEQCL